MGTAFYDQSYYESHYARFLPEDSYYRLKARFWRKAITALWPLNDTARILDYGCGLGQVSAAFEHCHYYDLAAFSRSFLLNRGKTVYAEASEIPRQAFDVVLSSHALEHTLDPFEQLTRFASYVKPHGALILILPIERDRRCHLEVDQNNHVFAWTFQNITNLLHASGWEPCLQELIYDSFLLKRLGRLLTEGSTISWAWRLGKLLHSYPSMFVVGKKKPSATP